MRLEYADKIYNLSTVEKITGEFALNCFYNEDKLHSIKIVFKSIDSMEIAYNLLLIYGYVALRDKGVKYVIM